MVSIELDCYLCTIRHLISNSNCALHISLDLSWQTSLASAAVAAAEDVRAAVRASRTAANARATASSAALSAQQACEKVEFATMDDARAAQTRSSIAQSHAIHAAVVEHEAKTVKRRATLALAHDVKTWNIHRKREMLRSCISYAKSQHEASRRAVDSWSSLCDGFIGTTIAPTTVDRRQVIAHTPPPSERRIPQIEPDEVTATIFDNFDDVSQPTILALDNNGLSANNTDFFSMDYARSIESRQPETFLPFAEASPIPEEVEEVESHTVQNRFEAENLCDPTMQPFTDTEIDHDLPDIAQYICQGNDNEVDNIPENVSRGSKIVDNAASGTDLAIDGKDSPLHTADLIQNVYEDVVGDLIDFSKGSNRYETSISNSNEEVLSESMQSLVVGLMNWGGGFEAEEEHFALPAGMATAIALEGSGAIGESSLL